MDTDLMWKTEYNPSTEFLSWRQTAPGSNEYCNIMFNGRNIFVSDSHNAGFNGFYGWVFI